MVFHSYYYSMQTDEAGNKCINLTRSYLGTFQELLPEVQSGVRVQANEAIINMIRPRIMRMLQTRFRNLLCTRKDFTKNNYTQRI